MKPTVLTKFDKQGNLCETHFRKQCLSLIGGIKEFEIMVAELCSQNLTSKVTYVKHISASNAWV